MTDENVRAVFFKNYSNDDLNHALMASIEEIMLTIIKESAEQPESLSEIIRTIVVGKSHAALFMGIKTETLLIVQTNDYLIRFDQVRKAMVGVVKYTLNNHETMNDWFRERFDKKHLTLMLNEMTFSIEKAAERPANVRTFHSSELKLYDEFFTTALIGIIGVERFKKYAEEYNRCAAVLRQCQIECRAFKGKVRTKES